MEAPLDGKRPVHPFLREKGANWCQDQVRFVFASNISFLLFICERDFCVLFWLAMIHLYREYSTSRKIPK